MMKNKKTIEDKILKYLKKNRFWWSASEIATELNSNLRYVRTILRDLREKEKVLFHETRICWKHLRYKHKAL